MASSRLFKVPQLGSKAQTKNEINSAVIVFSNLAFCLLNKFVSCILLAGTLLRNDVDKT